MSGKCVALMQPYFFPYPRYFRLFSEVDEFIVHDDIQFPKRGRVHRTQTAGPHGEPEWLTLPLRHQSQDTLIRDCAFSEDARTLFDKRLRHFGSIAAARGPAADRIRAYLHAPLTTFLDYVETGLRLVVGLLGMHTPVTRCSALGLPASLHGQERVIAAVRAAGATRYINLPGGRDLYDPAAFARHGIELAFLPTYEGPHRDMLRALMTLPPQDIAL